VIITALGSGELLYPFRIRETELKVDFEILVEVNDMKTMKE